MAVIDFNDGINSGLGHYVTHTKRVNGYWETYNDLNDNAIKCKYNKTVKPHALYYIRID